MPTKFNAGEIFICGEEIKIPIETCYLEANLDEIPDFHIPCLDECTLTIPFKPSWKLKLKWKWENFKFRRNSKKLAKLLQKCGYTIMTKGGDTKNGEKKD